MQLQTSALPDFIQRVAYIIAGVVAATIVIIKLSKGPNLNAIPTVGLNNRLGSWWAGQKFDMNAIEVIQKGYEKYKSAPFKVADRYRWIVVLGGRNHIEELQKAPDDEFSSFEEENDIVQIKYTMGPELLLDRHHVEVVRSHLTRNTRSLYTEVRDEIRIAFEEVLDLRDSGWKSIGALGAIQKVVCRTSNRVFVGLPLCRDPDWINLTVRHTQDVAKGAHIIRHFPGFLAPLVAYFMTDVPETTKRAIKHLVPIIEERLKLFEEHGKDWADKPNDLISWLLDEASEGSEHTAKYFTTRVLASNFAAIHTTSNSFFQALFLLAENPQFVQPLREEVESIVEKEGWSKASLDKMRKVDSFLKESQRLVGISAVSLMRRAMKDYTFSDGTHIPKGTSVLAPARCVHLDDDYYDNAHVFDPFRFSRVRAEEGEGTKHQFISTSTKYLVFGHGKHACPGRFFAVNELKTMLAHVIMSYDVKLEDGKTWPKVFFHSIYLAPNPTATIMFKRRIH